MSTPDGSGAEGTIHGFVQAFSMIIISEIGDKTFLIAAILAMRHPRLLVFAGAFGSLVVMSILSAAMGHVLPTLIPKRWTQLAAGVLFLIFGAKLFLEGKEMPSGNEKVLEEMREAEEEIDGDAAEHDGTGRVSTNGDVIPLEEIEAGGLAVGNGHARGDRPKPPSPLNRVFDGTRNLCSFLFGPVFVQAFVLTFLGEWGDRSQIATIMLAAAHVRETHSSCTAHLWLTVIDAECIRCCAWNDRRAYVLHRTRRHCWSLYFYKSLGKTWYAYLPPSALLQNLHPLSSVTLGGAVLFLCFGLIYLYEANQTTVDFDPQEHILRD
jgi:putative Ca2+/H+ antiporter (TMEM165/GDT1 family)